jgi:predicted nucleotidyltransferase
MIYTTEEIKRIVNQIAKKYELGAVYLFGSYARNEATDGSDIDFLIDRTNSKIKSLLDMGALYNDLFEKFGKSIDIVTTNSLEQPSNKRHNLDLKRNLKKEGMKIYERQ